MIYNLKTEKDGDGWSSKHRFHFPEFLSSILKLLLEESLLPEVIRSAVWRCLGEKSSHHSS